MCGSSMHIEELMSSFLIQLGDAQLRPSLLEDISMADKRQIL